MLSGLLGSTDHGGVWWICRIVGIRHARQIIVPGRNHSLEEERGDDVGGNRDFLQSRGVMRACARLVSDSAGFTFKVAPQDMSTAGFNLLFSASSWKPLPCLHRPFSNQGEMASPLGKRANPEK